MDFRGFLLIDSPILVGSCMARDCKGSPMRVTVKFAVICVSLIITANAGAATKRNRIDALSLQERGVRLRLELEREYKELQHTGEFKAGGNDGFLFAAPGFGVQQAAHVARPGRISQQSWLGPSLFSASRGADTASPADARCCRARRKNR